MNFSLKTMNPLSYVGEGSSIQYSELVMFPGRFEIQCFIHELIIVVGTIGKKHEVELNLGGMGGGGAIQLEVNKCDHHIVYMVCCYDKHIHH